jgi:ABC-type Mn2+/Zn2+ transport system permease subunit
VCSRLRRWQIATVLLVLAEGVAGLWLSVKTNAPPGATVAVLSGAVFAICALVHVTRARGRRTTQVTRELTAR